MKQPTYNLVFPNIPLFYCRWSKQKFSSWLSIYLWAAINNSAICTVIDDRTYPYTCSMTMRWVEKLDVYVYNLWLWKLILWRPVLVGRIIHCHLMFVVYAAVRMMGVEILLFDLTISKSFRRIGIYFWYSCFIVEFYFAGFS